MPNGRWSRFFVWSLVAAVVHPVAVLGLVVAAVHLTAAHAPGFLVVLLWTAVALVGVLTFALPVRANRTPDAVLISAGCLVTAALLTGHLATEVIIEARGSRTTCDIVAVELDVAVTGSGDLVGYHRYDLRCDSGPITAVDSHRRAGEPGQRLEIAYDPEGVYEPRPAADLHVPWYMYLLGTGAVLACLAVNLVAALRKPG
ncbi:hypothetical protein [Saccharothrix stipae]